jgi:RNA polymerase sigma factor (sigma-70 family)
MHETRPDRLIRRKGSTRLATESRRLMPTSEMSDVIQHLCSTIVQDGAGMTDGQLLDCFVTQRDHAAFAALVRRHGAMVWGVCRRVLRSQHDAEDAFQATFLVLVRRAASVLPRAMVANWLYGVAQQTALNARATGARRRTRETQVARMPEPAVEEQDRRHDLRAVLDQEVSRLPHKYRVAIVLCDLEGRRRREAARLLGVPEGTLSARLTRGRAMLAKRLARHGLPATGCALATAMAQNAASAAVPTPVVSSTIKAANLFAAGQAAATGVIPVKVAALMKGVLKAMLMTKLKAAIGVVLVVAILSCGAGLIYQTTQAAGEPKAQGATEKGKQQADGDGLLTEMIAQKVMLAYLHNDAKGDQEFLGKKLNVRGRVLRVERVVIGRAPHYLLTLYAAPSEDRFGGIIPMTDKTPLAFVFPADSQMQLAKLEGGQQVTIEGVCEGRTAEGRGAITFTACKIIKTGE